MSNLDKKKFIFLAPDVYRTSVFIKTD